jgi:hypothetical protein
MNAFRFYSENCDAPEYGRVVRLSKGIKSKRELLDFLAEALEFPSYFGCNWDALDECLTDLSWIPNDKIIIWHEDLPLINQPAEAKIYLEILRDLAVDLTVSRVEAYFPDTSKHEVESLVDKIIQPIKPKDTIKPGH